MRSRADSLRGGVRLVFDGVGGVTHIVERMHETIARRPLPWAGDPESPTRAHGLIAAGVYGTIKTINGWLRDGVDRVFEVATPPASAPGLAEPPRRASFIAVLNGVLGDYLESTYNPLAIPMHFRTRHAALGSSREANAAALPKATAHIAVLLHGLCMSERAWHRRGKGRMALALRKEVGLTPVFVRYNSGRRIATNGRELAQKLDELVDAWPVAVESITLVGHSMGGLIARSASAYAERDGRNWRRHLRSIVCLGSPHHGAPLEKGGHALDTALGLSPYVRPLAVGRLRSAGIRDLRHGTLVDEDWHNEKMPPAPGTRRGKLPLAEGVAHYFAAASVGRQRGRMHERVCGDLLVPVPSALGRHPDPERQLAIPSSNARVFYETDHLALLDDQEVVTQVVDWLRANVPGSGAGHEPPASR